MIPFRSDDRDRTLALGRTAGHWLALGLPVAVGHANNERFSKGASAAALIAEIPDHGGLIVADADALVAETWIRRAMALVEAGAAWVQPHSIVVRMTPRATTRVLHGAWPNREAPSMMAPPGGGAIVLSRWAWNRSGGIDPRFHGWGGDDISWARALDALAGPGVRLGGTLFHLWHRPSRRRAGNRGSLENEAIAAQYLEARDDEAAMRSVIASRTA